MAHNLIQLYTEPGYNDKPGNLITTIHVAKCECGWKEKASSELEVKLRYVRHRDHYGKA